ncbi:MAG TPA: ABC transporter permease [Candidatus Limnocylindrales bacterium]|nr:ABC transporter permease [Candidatus Limnocylindrales bacterium]
MATIAVGRQRPVAERASRGIWRDAARRLMRNGPALVGMFFIAVFLFMAILAPLLTTFDPVRGVLANQFEAPLTNGHWFGTDLEGRDEFARIVFGARLSLVVGVGSVIMGLFLGGTIGAAAGALGGRVDSVLMRIVDVLLAIPGILLAIGIVAWLGRGLPQIMLAVAATNAPVFARILRGSLLANREVDYVIAARSTGASRWRLLVRHLLPNSVTAVIVAATLALATAIIDVAGLGFLGFGPPDPRTAEWGTMLTDTTQYFREAPFLIFFPGLAIVITAIGFNLLGDGLRESLDPRLKR